MRSLNLEYIPPTLHACAREEFQQGNARGVLALADNLSGLRIVANNRLQLMARGIYEEALLVAYQGSRTNNCHLSVRLLSSLFSYAEKKRLRELGSSIGPGPFTLYRGVAGAGRDRRERGLSWTSTLTRGDVSRGTGNRE